MHRACDVLEFLFAGIFKGNLQLTLHLFLHPARDADPARLGQCFQACGYVYAVAPEVITMYDQLAKIYAHAELNPLFEVHFGVALEHAALNFDSAAHRVHDAGELSENPVPYDPNDPPVMFLNRGLDQTAPVCLPLGERPLIICAHKPAVPSHISSQNGNELSFYTLIGQDILRSSLGTILSYIRLRTLSGRPWDCSCSSK